jgi:hypothetical protein
MSTSSKRPLTIEEKEAKAARKEARRQKRARKRARHQDEGNAHEDEGNAHQDEGNAHEDEGNAHQDEGNAHQEGQEISQETCNPSLGPDAVGPGGDGAIDAAMMLLQKITTDQNIRACLQSVTIASTLVFTDDVTSAGDIVKAPLSFESFCHKFVTQEELMWFGRLHYVRKWINWLVEEDTVDPLRKHLNLFYATFLTTRENLE